MSSFATFGGSLVIGLSRCDSCSHIFYTYPGIRNWKFPYNRLLRVGSRRDSRVFCQVGETNNEPAGGTEEEIKSMEVDQGSVSDDSLIQNRVEDPQTVAESQIAMSVMHESNGPVKNGTDEKDADQEKTENVDVPVATGSPLPGLKKQNFDESVRIPKETIDILKDQVFGFDTFFVTGQEPYEGGVLFKGNLRGQASKSYEKIVRRMEDRFSGLYKFFLLINPEDEKPVAVVVPAKTTQPDTAAVPQWFAASAFGLVTIFTLLLRNVPALQANVLSVFDNVELLTNGLPGAFTTSLVLIAHEVGHLLVAKEAGIMLGVPYFVPSWQIGSFGAITRILNIVPNRKDMLKFAAAGPLAGFAVGFVLLLLGFILPPPDELGLVLEPSVFHESLLVGGAAKIILGDALKEGAPLSINPLVLWAWAGLLINAINTIPAGELDGGRISFSIWGRKIASRLTAGSIGLLGLSALFNDVAFYWVVLIWFLQRGPIAPLSEEITEPEDSYKAFGILVLALGLLVLLPFPFPFASTGEAIPSF